MSCLLPLCCERASADVVSLYRLRSNGLVDEKAARLKARNEQRERQREQREKRRAAEARARRYPMDDELLRDELIEEALENGAAHG